MSKYCVDFWGSDPVLENDDCFVGEDFDTLEEAMDLYNNPWKDATFAQYCRKDTAVIVLGGPDIWKQRANPDHVPSKGDNDDWRREIAMEAGMLGGVDAYNEVMGY